ncbi:hypothetical protein BDR04DRAFT_1143946 [Suillus decipiens]|nr:hypothetical protein BDR04DRAFT_1143946 [Suillus decipiens]
MLDTVPVYNSSMEYSSDDIAAARSLQLTTYMYVSMATFLCYDYIFLLREEWTYLLRSDWSKVKGLYIVTRYLPFILLITVLWMNFTPNENPGTCRVLINVNSGLGIASIIFSEYATYAIPGITECQQSSTSFQFFIPFLLLTVFELGLMILTLIRAIQSWRMNSSRLYVVLVKHNIFYYSCGLLLSVANILASLLFQYCDSNMLHIFEVMILAILATRMHLHLRQTNRRAYDSNDPANITMSDMSSMNFAA